MCANLLKYLLKPAAGGKRTIKVPVGSQAGWGTPGLGPTPLQLLQGQPAPPPPRLAPHQFVVNLCVAPCGGWGGSWPSPSTLGSQPLLPELRSQHSILLCFHICVLVQSPARLNARVHN